MHNIYSLHIFTVHVLDVWCSLHHYQGERMCSLLNTTCCYAFIIHG